ncbi:MAG: hypothetical protein HC858_04250 [Brachymonas sp.]|nr:hypothetical protein [Brachymonas sp.]
MAPSPDLIAEFIAEARGMTRWMLWLGVGITVGFVLIALFFLKRNFAFVRADRMVGRLVRKAKPMRET